MRWRSPREDPVSSVASYRQAAADARCSELAPKKLDGARRCRPEVPGRRVVDTSEASTRRCRGVGHARQGESASRGVRDRLWTGVNPAIVVQQIQSGIVYG